MGGRPTERTVNGRGEEGAAQGESQGRVLKARASYTFVSFPTVGAGLMRLPRSSTSVNLPAAHGQWYGIGGHPVWYKGATGSRQSRCSASNQACRWLSRGAAPGGREPESLGACSKGKTPCCRCELSTASPLGLQAKTPDQDTNAATSSSTGLEAMKECLAKVISSAPPAFCRVKGDGSHVVHFCRSVDAPSHQLSLCGSYHDWSWKRE